ncbi:DUF962-domain-containing protein [Violaceomyces palustris]|uniref:DUF962-domain-containing protein n=1 Tax=Violaceomyces palustris TaxID=1673888 RepID=A0ACD0NMR8_9BASI|nr:DUF962-domain-containing protein [Violaceomyces palustris]
MSAKLNPFDLKRQLAFYGAYHSNPSNVLIHMVGVPIIIFSTSIYLSTTPSLKPHLESILPSSFLHSSESLLYSTLPEWSTRNVKLDLSTLFMGSYLLYYFLLDPLAALLLSPIWFSLHHYSNLISSTLPSDQVTKIWSSLFLLGWISQFFGHGYFERRAPALLDNLLGAVVLAPFFVWLEFLFHLGYRTQLQKWLKNETGRLIAEFRREKAQKRRTR